MHKLNGESAAICAAQNRQHVINARCFKPQHIIDKNRPVEIFRRKAIRSRVKLRMAGWRLQPQRIQIGSQMTAKTIGAYHHNGAHQSSVAARTAASSAPTMRLCTFSANAPAEGKSSAQLPSNTAVISPFIAGGQSPRCHDGPPVTPPVPPSLSMIENRPASSRQEFYRQRENAHKALPDKEHWSHQETVLQRRPCQTCPIYPVTYCPSGLSVTTSFKTLDQFTNCEHRYLGKSLTQPCRTSTNVLPKAAGDGETVIPADRMASILSSAPPLPPAIIAPA